MKFLRLPEVVNATGLSRSSLYRLIEDGTFPSSIRIGGRSVAWCDEEVNAWIEERIRNQP
ncbi:MAG: AlpA family transcriptional regulator [Nitrincola sp.]|nr:AlpA family transcriptional regulator [Nitrincola sp.]